MKDKEKQIEEMAKEICSACLSIEEPCYMKKQPCSITKKQAERLYNAGYRKLPEDSVMLTKAEKEKLLKEMYEQGKFDALADLGKDGKVVLSREEFELLTDIKDLQQQVQDSLSNTSKDIERIEKQARKETAEKILNDIADLKIVDDKVCAYDLSNKLNKLAKQYGVEIKE